MSEVIKKKEARNVLIGEFVFIPARGEWLECKDRHSNGVKNAQYLRFAGKLDDWVMFHRLCLVETKKRG
jgi:hypothetical protein